MRRAKMAFISMVCVVVFLSLSNGEFAGSATESPTPTAVVVIENPMERPAEVTLTYMAAVGVEFQERTTVPGRSRTSLSLDGKLPSLWGASVTVSSDTPVVALASEYWKNPDGCWTTTAGSVALSQPSRTWYFTEGSTASGSETWIGVQNPNNTPAKVDISYITTSGFQSGPSFELSPTESRVVNASDTILGSFRGSAIVQADVPVYAHRAMVENDGESVQHDAGAPALSSRWYMAEGSTADGFDAFLVIGNPNPMPAEISIVYTTDGSSQRASTFLAMPQGVTDVHVGTALPDRVSFSAMVESDPGVVLEQTTTWAGGFDTAPGGTASTTWYFPDCGGQMGFESWLAAHNPGNAAAPVDFTFLTDEGPVTGPSLTCPPLGDVSVSPSDYVGIDTSASAIVTSSIPIVAMQGTYATCGDDLYRDTQLGATDPDTYWYLPLIPFEPRMGP